MTATNTNSPGKLKVAMLVYPGLTLLDHGWTPVAVGKAG